MIVYRTTKIAYMNYNKMSFISIKARCSTLYDKGMSYRGPVNYTSNGRACVSWQHHVHDVTPELYPYDGLDENYCRNPRGHQGAPWCYTSPENDGSKIWDYCPVRNCGKLEISMCCFLLFEDRIRKPMFTLYYTPVNS